MMSEVDLNKALERHELCEAIGQVFNLWRDAYDRKDQGEAGALVATKLWAAIHATCAETFLHGTDDEIKAIAEFLGRLDLRREAPRGPRPSGLGGPADAGRAEPGEASK